MEKFVICYETLSSGLECVKNEDETPCIFETADEAYKEIFDGNLSMLEVQTPEDLAGLNIAESTINLMREAYSTDDVTKMREFMKKHPECDYNSEFILKESQFVKGGAII